MLGLVGRQTFYPFYYRQPIEEPVEFGIGDDSQIDVKVVHRFLGFSIERLSCEGTINGRTINILAEPTKNHSMNRIGCYLRWEV